MVPEGWNSHPMKEILERVIDYRGKAPPKTEIGVRLLTARNVRPGYVSLNHAEYIDADLYEAWMNRGLPTTGDILFTTEAPLGNVAMFPTSGTFALGQRIVTLRTNQTADSGYLFQFLLSEHGQGLVHSKSSGSTALGIKSKELVKIKIPIPPLSEQRKIADILSTWDAAIEKTEALLATAKAQKRALMQSLLTGRRRFPEFEGQPWKEVRLGDVARIYDGTHATPKYVEHGVPFYSVEHLTKDQFRNTKYISEDVFEKENKRVKLERNDILMSRIGDVGTTRLIDWDVRASFYVSLALIKSVEDVSSEYLAQYMNSQDFQAELWKRMIHVAFPKKINLGEIGNCVVKLPSRKEQVRIAKALGDLDMEIKCSKSEVSKLRSEKKALMQQLLTGKRRVAVEDNYGV